MRMDCEAAREHADAAALGALDHDERRAFEQHVAGCRECTAVLDAARETASSVAIAAPLAASSAALKSRVMASAAVLNGVRHVPQVRWPTIAAAAAVVVAVGGLTWGGITQARLNDEQQARDAAEARVSAQSQELAEMRASFDESAARTLELAGTVDQQNQVIDIVLRPDVTKTELSATGAAPGATGRCIWSRTQGIGAVVAENLPPAPEGTAYEMWIIYEKEWISGGTLSVDREGYGRLIVRKVSGREADPGRFVGFAITLEPLDGSFGRTGDMVLASTRP